MTTMTMGEFNGADAASIRDHVRNQVQAAFAARRFSSEIFVVVAGNWAWGAILARPRAPARARREARRRVQVSRR